MTTRRQRLAVISAAVLPLVLVGGTALALTGAQHRGAPASSPASGSGAGAATAGAAVAGAPPAVSAAASAAAGVAGAAGEGHPPLPRAPQPTPLAHVPAAATGALPGAAAAPLRADDWTQFRRDPAHTGTNLQGGWAGPGSSVQWMTDRTEHEPVVAGGMVYTSAVETLDAFSLGGCGRALCAPRWSGTLGSPPLARPNMIVSSPIVAGDLVAASVNVDDEGWLFAFSRSGCGVVQCPPLWRGQVGVKIEMGQASLGSSLSSPVAVGDTLFAVGTQGYLRAFSLSGCGAPVCQPLWTGRMDDGSTGSPTVIGDRIVEVDNEGRMSAFPLGGCGAATCAPAWTVSLGDAPSNMTPAASDGRIFATTMDGSLGAYDATNGRLLWGAPVPGSDLRSSPAVVGGAVIVGSTGGVRAYDAATGRLLWTGPLAGSTAWASPTASSDRVYVTAGDSRVYAFNVGGCGTAPTCAPVWSFQQGPPMTGYGSDGPVSAEGRTLVLGDGARLACLE